MQGNGIAVFPGAQGAGVFSAEGAGLVPYTTSQTATAVRVGAMVGLSSTENRLRRLKHHVRTAGRLVKETMARSGANWRAVFVTLTYRKGVEWSPKHIAGFMDCVRKWSTRQGVKVGYVWVAETQKRGAVHYHAVVWVPRGLYLPRPDKKGWWRHGSTNLQAVKRNAVGYLMKYVSKGVGNYPDLPAGARICGSGGLDEMARNEFHFWRLPRFVREGLEAETWGPLRPGEQWDGRMRARRCSGGGWAQKGGEAVWCSDFGLFAIAYRERGEDCNGRKLRQETVTVLDRQYRRVQGGRGWDETVTAAVREAWFYADRATGDEWGVGFDWEQGGAYLFKLSAEQF